MYGAPWFVHCSIEFLEGRIQPDWVCFEWGSGGSTVWLAELARQVVSIEHNKEWYDTTNEWLKQYGLEDKAIVNLRELGNGYADYILKYPDAYFDLIEIDGRERALCLKYALPKLKPGGILVIDNSEREQYQASMNEAGIKKWEHVDFFSGHSDGWTTSVYFKPKGE